MVFSIVGQGAVRHAQPAIFSVLILRLESTG
jgi:hypothetical protein